MDQSTADRLYEVMRGVVRAETAAMDDALRDRFAIAALKAMGVIVAPVKWGTIDAMEKRARLAYEQAEIMLKVRNENISKRATGGEQADPASGAGAGESADREPNPANLSPTARRILSE